MDFDEIYQIMQTANINTKNTEKILKECTA